MSKLPDWGIDDLPEPPPYSVRNLFRVIGPGAILLAASIGGGEWLIGPSLAVKHGLNLMWIATLGIALQLMFNLEAIRYTLYTGEPILSGIMRLRPGAKFWATIYVTLTIAQLGVPALAKGSANVLFALFFSRAPTDLAGDQDAVLYITYGIIVFAVLLLLFGGTIERMLEWASWGMIAYIFIFLIYVNVRYVSAAHWGATFSGFFRFGQFPDGFFEAGVDSSAKLLLIAALAATAGSGGIGNLAITNWIRDKGFGMGGTVGAIPSAFGATKIQLSHVGKVFPVTEANMSRWRTWWKYIVADQVWLWGLGCFLGMFLNVNLATAIIPPDADMTGPAAGAIQGQHLAELWSGLWYLGLLNGFWILFSTHLGNTDILVRTVTDILWVSSDRLRAARGLSVGRLYYGLLLVMTIWGMIVVRLASAMTLFQILAAIAGLILVPAAIQIFIINSTMLPKALRPSWWRKGALIACAVFYGIVWCFALPDVTKKIKSAFQPPPPASSSAEPAKKS